MPKKGLVVSAELGRMQEGSHDKKGAIIGLCYT